MPEIGEIHILADERMRDRPVKLTISRNEPIAQCFEIVKQSSINSRLRRDLAGLRSPDMALIDRIRREILELTEDIAGVLQDLNQGAVC